jgi:hypothetical protein
VSSSVGFRVHGLLPTSQLEIVDGGENTSTSTPPPTVNNNSFVVSVEGNKVLVLAAFSERDKLEWVRDLKRAINKSKHGNVIMTQQQQQQYGSSTEEVTEGGVPRISNAGNATRSTNSLTHVCWHRNLSVCWDGILNGMKVGITLLIGRVN